MAKSYKPKTPDNTVSDINVVQIEKSEDIVDTTFLTLNYLDTQINLKTAQVVALQAELTTLETERALVATEAAKIKLKWHEPEEV